MNDREVVLAALGPAPAVMPPEPEIIEGALYPRTPDTAQDALWDHFEARLAALGGRMLYQLELEGLCAREGKWVDPDAGAELGIDSDAEDLWDAQFGFCRADFAIAETGSLALSASAGCNRLSSLVPPVNVVLVRKQDIVRTLTEGVERLSRRTSVLVTGPSRTADIEGVLVRGIHGPAELLVYVKE